MEETKIKSALKGSHYIDPRADVILVFDSKNVVVSHQNDLNLINAEDWNAMVEAQEDLSEYQSDAPTEALSTATAAADAQTRSKQEDEDQSMSCSDKRLFELDVADIDIHVSSRHLILKSKVFAAMLERARFAEGNTLHQEGSVRIWLDDPAEGMLILLKMVHGDWNIPTMTPSLMMQIAICEIGRAHV